jgi:hypothetical protein
MAKKKTEKKAVSCGTPVKNCTFTGVTYDKQACESIAVVAEGLLQTARGLSVLARVFNAQDIHIDSMIKLTQ